MSYKKKLEEIEEKEARARKVTAIVAIIGGIVMLYLFITVLESIL